MLKSLKRLRNMPNKTQHTYALNAVCNEIADEIEREIAERYMPLPVDADGVSWIPTELWFIDPYGEKRALVSMSLIVDKEPKLWILEGSNSMDDMEFEASKCRHVKSRTVEDVLRDLLKTFTNRDLDYLGEVESAKLRECADELRELLGGDAE